VSAFDPFPEKFGTGWGQAVPPKPSNVPLSPYIVPTGKKTRIFEDFWMVCGTSRDDAITPKKAASSPFTAVTGVRIPLGTPPLKKLIDN
jgi:hypothetical protein